MVCRLSRAKPLSKPMLASSQPHSLQWGYMSAIITVTSQWAHWRLKSPASWLFPQPFVQAQIKENIKAPRHWPLWWEFTGHPTKMASNAENVPNWWRHHDGISNLQELGSWNGLYFTIYADWGWSVCGRSDKAWYTVRKSNRLFDL